LFNKIARVRTILWKEICWIQIWK